MTLIEEISRLAGKISHVQTLFCGNPRKTMLPTSSGGARLILLVICLFTEILVFLFVC